MFKIAQDWHTIIADVFPMYRVARERLSEPTLVIYSTPTARAKIEHTLRAKLQTLVYDILPSTTAVFSYAIGPPKTVS